MESNIFNFQFHTHILLTWQWQTRAAVQQWISFSLLHLWPGFPSLQARARQCLQRQFTQWSFFKHTKALQSKAPLRCFQFPSALCFKKGIRHWRRILWMENFIRENFTLGGVLNTSALYWLKGKDNKNNLKIKKEFESKAKMERSHTFFKINPFFIICTGRRRQVWIPGYFLPLAAQPSQQTEWKKEKKSAQSPHFQSTALGEHRMGHWQPLQQPRDWEFCRAHLPNPSLESTSHFRGKALALS